ncbi:hypothetical protein CYMTET_23889 [Cymbomonas tetramitiformis]|uniref:Uncharacterized protein n=1 Tax=Cymbomonas tetramitiformis TaxID=36881 RepID=A0AAE0FYE1_9CHLO|nr:hypothetical protein CYMTET_23889 [Cymbomonas tetramitiformis]
MCFLRDVLPGAWISDNLRRILPSQSPQPRRRWKIGKLLVNGLKGTANLLNRNKADREAKEAEDAEKMRQQITERLRLLILPILIVRS